MISRSLFRFVKNKNFPDVSKNQQQTSFEKLDYVQIVTTYRKGRDSSSERLTEAFESRLQRKASNIIDSQIKNCETSVGESASTPGHRICNKCMKYAPTKVLDHWIRNYFKENQVELGQFLAKKHQSNSSTDGAITTRTT